MTNWCRMLCPSTDIDTKKLGRRVSMYNGIFTYIWANFGVNVDKYSIHGAYGIGWV